MALPQNLLECLHIKRIEMATILNIREVDNDNIDVIVHLEDGYHYSLVLVTPKNLVYLMEKEKCFIDVENPMVIVKELTMDCIEPAIQALCADEAYWLKEYHLSGYFGIELLNKMIDSTVL